MQIEKKEFRSHKFALDVIQIPSTNKFRIAQMRGRGRSESRGRGGSVASGGGRGLRGVGRGAGRGIVINPPSAPAAAPRVPECQICTLAFSDTTRVPRQLGFVMFPLARMFRRCGHSYCHACLIQCRPRAPTMQFACPSCNSVEPRVDFGDITASISRS